MIPIRRGTAKRLGLHQPYVQAPAFPMTVEQWSASMAMVREAFNAFAFRAPRQVEELSTKEGP